MSTGPGPSDTASAGRRMPGLPDHLADNPCPRCGADMIWTKASWHCLRCRYKEGCC